MLMVTTTVGMVNRVHSNTASSWPVVPLRLCLPHRARSFQKRLVGSSTTSDNSNHSTSGRWEDLLGAGWELDAGLAFVGVVTDDGDVVSRGTAESTSITGSLFNVGHNSSFGTGGEWEDVSDVEGRFLSGIDELTRVHAFIGDEGFLVDFESVWVSEDNSS